MLKKVLSLFLSFTLTFTSIGVYSVNASENNVNETGSETKTETGTETEEIVDYVVTGGSIQFDKSSGTVKSCNTSVTEANIPEEIEGIKVTVIGNNAFKNCTNLIEITLPNSITSIGGYAFSNCTNLTRIDIPNSVKTIGNSAFQNCAELTEITIPASVASIGNRSFVGCPKLTKIDISEENNQLCYDNGVLYSKDKKYIYAVLIIPSDGKFTVADGVTNIAHSAFFNCTELKEIIIPESVTLIKEYAFSGCTNLTEVTIPSKVSRIGMHTFENCTNLKKVIISEGTKNNVGIDRFAFSGCTSLTEITIPNNVSYIRDSAFENCTKLAEVTIIGRTTSIGSSAFKNCSDELKFNIYKGSEAEKYLSDEGFDSSRINYLTDDNIIDYVVTGGSIQFDKEKKAIISYSGNITEVVIPDKIEDIDVVSINYGVFNNCGSLEKFTFSNNITSITNQMFSNCTSLKEVTIPKSITSIDDTAFSSYEGMIFNIYRGSYADKYIMNNSNFDSSKINYLSDENIIDYVVTGGTIQFNKENNKIISYSGNITEVIIPEKIEEFYVINIGRNSFVNCKSLTEITLPQSIRNIEGDAFYGCSCKFKVYKGSMAEGFLTMSGHTNIEYIVDENTVNYPVIGGNIQFDKKAGSVIRCDENVTEVIIPDKIDGVSVIKIGDNAFSNCELLTKVTLPEGLDSIENRAFYGCKNLTEIILPNSLTSIKSYAFAVSGLTEITIPENVKTIGLNAFNTSSFKSMTIAEGNQDYSFDNGMLYNKDKTKMIELLIVPEDGIFIGLEGVTDIEESAFAYKSNIKEIILPESLESIKSRAFAYCKNLTEIIIPRNITSISDNMFEGCEALTKVTFPENIKSIGNFAFSTCTSLEEITIPESVLSIGNSAFSSCTKLKEITIPKSVASIGEYYVFYNCSDDLKFKVYKDSYAETYLLNDQNNDYSSRIIYLTEEDVINYPAVGGYIKFDKSTNTIIDCDESVTSANIPDMIGEVNVAIIGKNAFKNCKNLTEITLPNSITEIGHDAFYKCEKLQAITIPYGVTEIGYSAFEDCDSLQEIIIPESVTKFGGGSIFRSCNNLKKAVIPDSITSIPNNLFHNCNNLSDLTLSKNITSINSSAFRDCTSLQKIVIPDGTKSIGVEAFRGCSGATEIIIPDSVTFINMNAFTGCTSLREIEIPKGISKIGSSCFSSCTSLTKVSFPSNIKKIDTGAFKGCSSLTEVTIPAETTSISQYAFDKCYNLKSVTIAEENPKYCIENGALLTKDKTKMVDLMIIPKNGIFTVCNSVKEIGSNAFQYSNGLREVIMSDNVISLGISFTFSDCIDLQKVRLSNNIDSIPIGGFEGCISLKEITLPDNITIIKISAFSGCSNLEKIIIPDNVTSIESDAFNNCSSLKEAVIPKSVSSMGTSDGHFVFYKCPDDLIFRVYKDSYAENYIISKGKVDPSRIFYLTELTLGDIDGDPVLNVNDAAVLLKKVLDSGSNMPIEEFYGYMKVIDVDGDGFLTAKDVAIVLKEAI